MGIHCNRYFLTAEAFGAEEARRVGLLSDVVEDADGLQDMEAKLQDQFMIVSPDAVSASKGPCHASLSHAGTPAALPAA